ncbi:serine protease [Bdellovibrio sp. 22V]|uniref:trypsin-like serine peptidase n=1 Tax=Bdellovibrio sp. 22V TaxID=3044166 RepID=UPI002542B07F|nr:serine protease [Bdellovibrio sp. 22V]WII70903.1 serine protease [Bdellovibrio sp. 22V]
MKSFLIAALFILQSTLVFAKDLRTFSHVGEYEAVGRIQAILPSDYASYGISLSKDLVRLHEENESKGHSTYYSFCSATLIQANKILTAAHCIAQMREFQYLGLRVFFVPNTRENISVQIAGMDRAGDINSDRRFADDWAILTLQNDITSIKPLKLMRLAPQQYFTTELVSVGYPDEAQRKTLHGLQQTQSRCYFRTPEEIAGKFKDEPRFVRASFTNCSISGGNSGGPLLFLYQDENGPALGIAGINVGGVNSLMHKLKFKSDYDKGVATSSSWILDHL